MNFNTPGNSQALKRFSLIFIGGLITLCIFHEIMFWNFMHESNQLFNKFNTEFSQQQQEIKSILDKSDHQFAERRKEFDAESEKFSQTVKENQKNMFDYIARIQKEQEDREKSFTQSFKAAPKKMWDEHEKFGEAMQRNFMKESKK